MGSNGFVNEARIDDFLVFIEGPQTVVAGDEVFWPGLQILVVGVVGFLSDRLLCRCRLGQYSAAYLRHSGKSALCRLLGHVALVAGGILTAWTSSIFHLVLGPHSVELLLG